MPQYTTNIREEELKNRLRQDYFADYDASPILGNIDFAVAVPAKAGAQLFETEYLLWAEAKKGAHADIRESFVQLIMTIGRARTFDHHLPPAFLGAFDAEKIAFIPYYKVLDVFSQNDFNWNVAPSDHSTREFQQLLALVASTLDSELMLFRYGSDDGELRRFVRQNFVAGRSRLSKIRISKNNFTAIYQKWRREVMPSINIDWDAAKRAGIIDADFYLADILSKDNATLKDKLYVLLRSDHYILDRRVNDTGLKEYKIAEFHDEQKAHRLFWNRYDRPPRREYWDYIVERRDLLVPQDVRERKGSYFTPQQWVELSQQYLADELGDDWQDEYAVWDCCAGTGNLLVGLTNKWNVYASTLDQADVDVMRDRINNGANLLSSHVFQFDFLNDPFTRLPQSLQDIINDPERRKKLVVYINPPYAEAGNIKQVSGTGKNKTGVAVNSKVYSKYFSQIGIAGRELFALFFFRIYQEIQGCILSEFSKLKVLQAPNFDSFRKQFHAKLCRSFIVPANTFDNVKGTFPIGFFIWNTGDEDGIFKQTYSDVYNAEGSLIGTKLLLSPPDKTLTDWLISTRNRPYEKHIGYLSSGRNDFQNQNLVFIVNDKAQLPTPRGTWITTKNLAEICIFVAVRKVIPATWLNDRDQFLYPNDGWQTDYEFQTDSLVYTLFNNNIQSLYGVNHWIPFTEAEVDAKEKFASHFMSDYLHGKLRQQKAAPTQPDLFASVGARTLLSSQSSANVVTPTPTAAQVGATTSPLSQYVTEQETSLSVRGCGDGDVAAPTLVLGESVDEDTSALGDDRSVVAPTMTLTGTDRSVVAPILHLSEEARTVIDAGRELWRYYHAQPGANPNASFYDIRLHFQGTKTTASGKTQMNADSSDPRYTELIATLRQRLKALASHIEPKVYAYGFLRK